MTPEAIDSAVAQRPKAATTEDHPPLVAPVVHAGDRVAYVPGIWHARDRDAHGSRVFAFVHMASGPMRKGAPLYHKGDKANLNTLGSLRHEDGAKRDPKTEIITTAGGHAIRPTTPLAAWRATVLAVKTAGKVDLRIQHPRGHILECVDVPFAEGEASPTLHTWHPALGA